MLKSYVTCIELCKVLTMEPIRVALKDSKRIRPSLGPPQSL